MSAHDDDADLQPTFAEGFKLGAEKSVDEYAELDKNDESLNRWKASLGIGAPGAAAASGPKVTVLSLSLKSSTLPADKVMDLSNPAVVETYKKNPFNIKEKVEYNVVIKFRVNHGIVSGLRYMHAVKAAKMTVDTVEEMIGSYGPKPDGSAHEVTLPTDESPGGMVARAAGTYTVTSKIVDDDRQEYAKFQWSFKLTKDW
ncbi:hypothetical protein M407DRAFT_244850 [Tulasnella calospora MUT 4182]|uniref:Rho GDP-dissociation inhibitor n=1 Tax=Tulasnella calospora MUT 4182 TaxID=1051891 RepID=A0A0C3LP56_9AGAM|nr:hypothetical protein M407DRAFT_244850 [Tulasnella calospora MUT 4182]